MQRDKGANFERLVVNRLKAEGFTDAERLAPLQAGSGERHADVAFGDWRLECKHHEKVSVVTFDSWTDKPRHALVYRHNGKRPKVVVDLADFLLLVRKAAHGEAGTRSAQHLDLSAADEGGHQGEPAVVGHAGPG